MNGHKNNSAKLFFGFLPLLILLFSPIVCMILGDVIGMITVLAGVLLLSAGVLLGKIGLFG